MSCLLHWQWRWANSCDHWLRAPELIGDAAPVEALADGRDDCDAPKHFPERRRRKQEQVVESLNAGMLDVLVEGLR